MSLVGCFATINQEIREPLARASWNLQRKLYRSCAPESWNQVRLDRHRRSRGRKTRGPRAILTPDRYLP